MPSHVHLLAGPPPKRGNPWGLPVALAALLLAAATGLRAETLLHDTFEDAHAAGELPGTASDDGVPRLVVDPHRLMSADHGAVRFPPPPTNQWGAEGLSYGPFTGGPGLCLSVRVRPGDCMDWSGTSRFKFALGLFPTANPSDPLASIQAVAFGRSPAGQPGALYIPALHGSVPLVEPLTQVDFQVIATCRDDSMVWYVSGPSGLPSVAAYPAMRPFAIVPIPRGRTFAGLHQRAQRDAAHATRLEGIHVERWDGALGWSGLAAVSRIDCEGTLRSGQANPGGPTLLRSGSRTISTLPGPVGLVSWMTEVHGTNGADSVVFRGVNALNHWRMDLSPQAIRLTRVVDGFDSAPLEHLLPPGPAGVVRRVWIVDDGRVILVWLDQALILSAVDATHGNGNETGYITRGGAGIRIHHFEAHLRSTPIPEPLRLGEPFQTRATRWVATESFAGRPGSLHGRRLDPLGSWQRRAESDGDDILVTGRGNVQAAGGNRGSLSMLVPWLDPISADVAVEIRAADAPGESRGSLVLGQDAGNGLVLGCDMRPRRAGGWCVGQGVRVPIDVILPDTLLKRGGVMRVASDGDHYIFWLNDVPVVCARVSDSFPDLDRFQLRELGIGVTRGDGRGDQETLFSEFRAGRTPPPPPKGLASDWRQPGLVRAVPSPRRIVEVPRVEDGRGSALWTNRVSPGRPQAVPGSGGPRR